jgi:hypothetical protein
MNLPGIFLGVKGGWGIRPSVIRLSRKCGSLDIPQPYWPPQPVTGIALPFGSYYSVITKASYEYHDL